MEEIEKRLAAIEERNQRVELEKAWETSVARKVILVLLTYLIMCLVFWSLGVQDFSKNAIIPTLGYYLSTQSLPLFKRLWLMRKDMQSQGKDL